MRVLQLIDSLEAGGAERVAVNIANALVYKVEGSYICTTRKEGLLKESIDKNVGYLFLKKKSTLDFKSILLLYRFIKSKKITIIHAHSSSFFLATIIRFFCPKLKLVWHDHYGNSHFLDNRPMRVLRTCSRYFNHIVSVNSKLKVWAENNLKHKNISYLPNFSVETINKCITKLKGEKGKRIICLANLRPQKDHLNLLKGFKSLVEAFPEWTLHLVGQDFKDDYSRTIFDYIKKENLNQNIFFYGSCMDTFYILKQCDIGVLSSKSEGLPLALLEYGLVGLPTVVTNVGDCAEVISDKNFGFLISKNNSKELSTTLQYCIENPIEVTKRGKALKGKIKFYFSEKVTIKKILTIYNSI